jgi:hypothetical protein
MDRSNDAPKRAWLMNQAFRPSVWHGGVRSRGASRTVAKGEAVKTAGQLKRTVLKGVLQKGKILELTDGSRWRIWPAHNQRARAWSPGCSIEVYEFEKYLCTHSIYHVASKRAVGAIRFPRKWTFKDLEDWAEKLISFLRWAMDDPS